MDSPSDPTETYFDEVDADHVTITQGGAANVQATTVEVTQGGIQAAQAGTISITQGGAMRVDAADADLTMGGAGVITGDRVDLRQSGAGIVVADTLKADEKSVIGVLFAGTIEGNPDVKVDARTAAAFGAGLGATLFVLKRLFRRQ